MLALFIFVFQIMIAFLSGLGFLGTVNGFAGTVNIPSDTTNTNPTSLASGLNVQTCGGIPLACSTIVVIGGALLSSVLFFGAWAFGLALWLGFYGSALLDIHFLMVNTFNIPLTFASGIDLICLAAFAGDLIYMYSWRDVNA